MNANVYMNWKNTMYYITLCIWNEKLLYMIMYRIHEMKKTLHMIIYHIDELKKYYILYYIVYMK